MDLSFKRFLASSLLSVAVLFSMASTAAAKTYTYAGNNFTHATGSYTTAMSVDISVTLSITLGANLTGFDAQPSITSFTATDGLKVVTEASDLGPQLFVVSTNATGDIVAWSWRSPLAQANDDLNTCRWGPGAGITGCNEENIGLDSGQSPGAANNANVANDPGTWTTVVPEPSSALLIAMGLAGLGWRGRGKHA